VEGRVGNREGEGGREGKDAKGEGGMGRGRKSKGRERAEGRDKIWKAEGGLDLDICPGAPELLVTPLKPPSTL